MLGRSKRKDVALGAGIKLLVLGFMALVGCGESTGTPAVTLSGRVTEHVPGSTALGPAIPGVEVCQFASNNCALTDENGDYALRVWKNRELEISYVKEQFGSVLVARQSGIRDFVGDAVLATDEDLSELASEINTPYPLIGNGALSMTTYRGRVSDGIRIAGISYSLTGSNGRSFYLDDAWVPDTSLTETQAPGAGGFVELAPVTVNVRLSGPAVNLRVRRVMAHSEYQHLPAPHSNRLLDSKQSPLRVTRR